MILTSIMGDKEVTILVGHDLGGDGIMTDGWASNYWEYSLLRVWNISVYPIRVSSVHPIEDIR